MGLKQIYLETVKEMGLQDDPLQVDAVQRLQSISTQLATKKPSKFSFFNKALYPDIQGIYLWGGVGRGKTFIMDIFYNSVPIEKKKRQHFSHFMKDMHSMLRNYKGQKNPISKVAYEMAKETQLICFDEFFVEDIADAMILGNVFKELFALGVVLVATSNIPPQKLYSNGLQRELFLPAIDVLLHSVYVLNLDSGVDYRFRLPTDYLNYLYPYNESNRKKFFDKFFLLSDIFNKNRTIQIIGRSVETVIISEDAVCFDFEVLCGDGRGTQDYIDICERYKHVFICNLVEFDENNEDMARRFIALIDECYDQDIHTIILAVSDFKELYKGKRLAFEFQRTVSRLNDMQNQNFGVSDV